MKNREEINLSDIKMKTEFDLSEKIGFVDSWNIKDEEDIHPSHKQGVFELEDVKEFIIDIQNKVLLNWKGQNEFIDWLKEKSGDKLIEVEK